VVKPSQALVLAEEAGLDLVEISPNAVPPVCKIMDFGKYKYELQKREAEARKKQKIIEIKEIKFRPNTDTNDYDVKMRNVVRFIMDERPFRSVLYIPGSKERALERRGPAADAIIFDLEDAVAPDEKANARDLLARTLARPIMAGARNWCGSTRCRPNGARTIWT
jgi:translation initiation factor IF-3